MDRSLLELVGRKAEEHADQGLGKTEPNVEPLLLKPEEAARALRVSRSQLFLMLARGELASITIGRSRRVPLDAVKEYVRLETERQATSSERGGMR